MQLKAALLDLPTERLISFARVALAGFGLAAIYIDPTQPAHNEAATYAILVAYLAYALLLAGAALYYRPNTVFQISVHLIDIVAFSVLMHWTVGPTSPYFVFFTFALLAAMLRWNWPGAIGTSGLLVTLLLFISFSEGRGLAEENDEINLFIMREAHLLVVGAMLGYVGAFRERSKERLAKLASWPLEQVGSPDFPRLDRSLAYAAEVMRARRILVAWEEVDEPFVYTSLWSDGHSVNAKELAGTFGDLVAPDLKRAAFMTNDPARDPPVLASGVWRSHVECPAIDPGIMRKFQVGRVVTAPFGVANIDGRVFVLDPERMSDDLLAIAEIIAFRVGVEIERYARQVELQIAAAARERVRLARDMHDGTLQTLTAVGLRLTSIAQASTHSLRDQLEDVRDILADQQRRIRTFVEEALTPPFDIDDRIDGDWDAAGAEPPGENGPLSLKFECARALAESSRQWGCATSLDVFPEHAVVPRSITDQVSLILAEAVANSARHGQADHVEVQIEVGSYSLALRIRDDGKGLEGLAGAFDHARLAAENIGPVSIRERVAENGGDIVLLSSDAGLALLMEMPLK